MAARPFGKAFEDRVIALANNAGPRGLTPAQFEANVRAYVQEMEQKPGFYGWGKSDMEPRYRRTDYYGRRQTETTSPQHPLYQDSGRMAGTVPHKAIPVEKERYPNTTPTRMTNRFQPESRIGGMEPGRKDDRSRPIVVRYANLSPSYEEDETPDLPDGMIEEEWVARILALNIVEKPPMKDEAKRKYGQGPRPCFVCGKDGHSWIRCEAKKKGKCAACGSQAHFTRHCANRYFPRPEAIIHMLVHGSGYAPEPGDGFAQTQEDDHQESETPAQMDFFHALLTPTPKPRWLEDEAMALPCIMTKEPGILPVKDPNREGLLYYKITLDGKPAHMLLDSRATHCIIARKWIQQHRLPTYELPRPIAISHVEGAAQQRITEGCSVKQLRIGRFQCAWTFLILETLPMDVIIGLDFIRRHRFLLDGATDTLYPPDGTNDRLQTGASGKEPIRRRCEVGSPRTRPRAFGVLPSGVLHRDPRSRVMTTTIQLHERMRRTRTLQLRKKESYALKDWAPRSTQSLPILRKKLKS